MKTHYIKAVTPNDLEVIRILARVVWFAHYPGIITRKQISYMLDQGYTIEALQDDLTKGVTMTLLVIEDIPAGFAAFGPVPREVGTRDGARAKLHKLYLDPSFHGQGFGSILLLDAQTRCLDQGYSHLTLAVNKHNARAIETYKRHGYRIIKSVLEAIGSGFYMDDYIMLRDLADAPAIRESPLQ